MRTVVDASALAKTFLDEEHADAFRGFVKDAIEANTDLVAPTLISYEMGNIVAAQFPEAEPEEQGQILADALTLVRRTPIEAPTRVLGFADDAGSFYDASYLWTARREEAQLVTYDEELALATEVHDVPLVQPGLERP